jgi:dTDP-4-dehydrorhamnose reductase
LIVLFGGDGQLGRALAKQSASHRIELRALSRHDADITDVAAVARALSRWEPDVVVNAAAYTKVDRAESEPELARLGNERGPATLAAACNSAGIPLIHVSTDHVFDGQKGGGYLETDLVCPINAYGRSKAAGEAAVRATLDRHLILRTAWLYSENGENFFKTMLRLAQTRDELRIVADQYGSPTSAHAIAKAILQIVPVLARHEPVYGTYHLTAGGVTTWHGFASRIIALTAPMTGRNPAVVPISTEQFPTAARLPANSALQCEKFARVFGLRLPNWADELVAVIAATFDAGEFDTSHVA